MAEYYCPAIIEPVTVKSPTEATELGYAYNMYGIRFDQPSCVYMIRLDSSFAVESPDGGVGKPHRNARKPTLDSQHVPRAERAGKGFYDGLSHRRSQMNIDNRENPYATQPRLRGHTNVPWMPAKYSAECLQTLGVITDGFDVKGFEHDVCVRGMPASLELDTGNAGIDSHRDSGYKCVSVHWGCPS